MVLVRRAREDFVVARPSELHPRRPDYGASNSSLSPEPDAIRATMRSDTQPHTAHRRMERQESHVRTFAVMLAIVLAGGLVAAAIPLLLSWLGS